MNIIFIISLICALYIFIIFELKIINLQSNIDRVLILSNAKIFIDKCFNQHSILNKFEIDNTSEISTIIPLYNCEKTISASIISILNQNFTNFEINVFLLR